MSIDLESRAKAIRLNVIKSTGAAGSGHPGGSLSIADILAVLYFQHLRHNPADPDWPLRDRVVLSKGHSAPALYSALALAGYFPLDEVMTLRKLGSRLQGHPSTALGLPGVEASTGSLGQGLSMAAGMALSARMDRADWRVYAVLGDGECQEGMVWEAAMAAAHYHLDNLIAIVDHNGLQIDGPCDQVMRVEPLGDKWRSFGWEVAEIDGHDRGQIAGALEWASGVSSSAGREPRGLSGSQGSPHVIIARTVKGKGVSFMENKVKWHGEAAKGEELKQAILELS